MTHRGVATGLAFALIAGGGALLAPSVALAAKAWLAERLIDRALDAHLEDGATHRPWGWADTWPVARLEVPRLRIRRPVLEGATGNVLAFGLGHVHGTAAPGGPGNAVVAGHRDGPAAFLRNVRAGDEIRLVSPRGTTAYRIVSTAVVPKDAVGVLAPSTDARLTLVTCWPFSGLRRSPWRYVVVARAGEPTSLRERSASASGSAPRSRS